MNYILGLDLGPTSIGWAVMECDANEKPIRLVDANSRIFLAMIEADTKVPKNKNRREKRSMRRQVRRYKERRGDLLDLLVRHGMFDASDNDPLTWEKALNDLGHPFALRAEALTRPLAPAELGRVFLHLLRRRGYKSNRGAKYQVLLDELRMRGLALDLEEEQAGPRDEEVDEAAKETGAMLSGIKLLRAAMEEMKCQTIAQLVVELATKAGDGRPRRPHTVTRQEQNKKGKAIQYHLYASRELCEEEFAKIWEAQTRHNPQLLTVELKIAIHRAIFFQRPLQSQRGRVGKCSLELKKPRAAKALLEAQEYRLLEDMNNLEYQLPRQHGAFRLSEMERETLLRTLGDPSKVNQRGQVTWGEIRKLIGRPKAKFNLERTSKYGLTGNRTALALARIMPAAWEALSANKGVHETYSSLQRLLVHDLINIEDKLALFNRLTNRYGLPPERCPWRFPERDAFALVTLELAEGYAKHCRSVIEALLSHLRDGMIYTDALAAAGYLRRDQREHRGLAQLPEPPNIANPIVQKALFETRRVVNDLIVRYGRKPRVIRIEMAREMKASKVHRADMEKQQRANQKANDDAAKAIRELAGTYPDLGIRVSREAILKYKLLLEQGRRCAYSSPERTITERHLFDGSVEIDHIYPLSVSLDDSYMNKVLCFCAANRDKGQRTPWQAWNGTKKYEEILKRLEGLPDFPKGKLKRIKNDKFDATIDFVAAQLNDTRYICVAVRNYLVTLGYDDQHLQVTRGQITAELRRLWGLVNVLPKSPEGGSGTNMEDGSTPSTEAVVKNESGKKKDRGDHRHHAVDAIVTALVDRGVFADLMRRYRHREEHGIWPDQPLQAPIPNLRLDAERILLANVVSHAANRKVSGGLHDELPFGLGFWIEENVPLKKLLRNPELIRTSPDGILGKGLERGEKWIANQLERETLQQWLDGYERGGKAKDYPPPFLPDGAEVKAVAVANRCFVKRFSVQDALLRVDNKPGQKTWIVDQGTRAALKAWRQDHKDKDAESSPPLMPCRDMAKAPPIRSVRMATHASGLVRFGNRPQIFAKGSNHHIAIFRRVLGDGTIERKGIFVDMLEAARRVREPPIIRKDPAQLIAHNAGINAADWQFELALCSQDMVLWDESAVPEDQKQLGKPIYRLQKMSGANNTLIFRHFSVTSTSDTDRRGLIQRTPETLPGDLHKIRVNALGEWESVSRD
ncbi:MAG: type II CRISPR RNA-guided endonuclease Cas9 [Betaproteobacteria bacterium]|nr:type II CRISPR RNA-guided endonuclease Cas9 [Betaproteobacteria bacterium]